MMTDDIRERRREKLRRLIDERFEGRAANLVRYYNLSQAQQSHISQILNRAKPFGERAARKMEEQMGVEPGWFDADSILPGRGVGGTSTGPIKYDIRKAEQLSPQDRKAVEQLVDFLYAKMAEKGRVVRKSATPRAVEATPESNAGEEATNDPAAPSESAGVSDNSLGGDELGGPIVQPDTESQQNT